MKYNLFLVEIVFLCFIYNIHNNAASVTSSQFLALVQGNWSFSDLPTSTWAERRYKCNRKLDFSCDCKTASKTYDIGYQETTHPFCIANPTHGSCSGGCLDVFDTNFISTYATQGACETVKRVWVPPLMPRCRQEDNTDVYGPTCDTDSKCTTGNCASLNNCQVGGTACTQAFWEDQVTDQSICTKYGLGASPCTIPAAGVAGKCTLNGNDVTATYGTEAQCLSAMTWIPALSIMPTYYEMSKYNSGASSFTENNKRQCAAGVDAQAALGGAKECPYEDSFCNRYPRIDEVDRDSDNYNQFMLHSSFTTQGVIKQCDYLGALNNATSMYDAQEYPLAPCPDSSVPYYCDYPQNELFGIYINKTLNDDIVDTTCGVGKYNNESRKTNGLPHGIREYNNGYDRQAWQWSIEMEDPVSASTAMNAIMTETESVQMNIFSVGKLVDKKYVLTSHREGFDELKVNQENALELNSLFELLAKTGDAVKISDLKSEAEVREAAEWSPSDVDEDGSVSQFRCHSVPDSVVTQFRQIDDVRKDFIDQFFSANTAQDCKFGQAALDNEPRSFERCDNSNETKSFLYPSPRKAFFNPITSDGYLSGFKKGQRFIKEMSRSTDNIGKVDAGLRTMPDGTEVYQNASFKHIKFMMAMSTDQLEQCNTVTGHCRNLWYEFPRKTYDASAASRIGQPLVDANFTHVEGCKLACINEAECGGFELDVGVECKLVKKVGTRLSDAQAYTDLRMEVKESPDYTAYFLERPDCQFRILGTRKYDAAGDGVHGLWGVSYDQNGGERWGYQTCRTSITVKKLEKIDAKDVADGLFNDPGETFIDEYPYTIIVQDEDCMDTTIEMEESVAQETSAAVSLSESQEVVKITATSTPDWCKTENGFYTGEQKQSQNGGVCLSHKQLARSEFLDVSAPFGPLVSRQPECLDVTGVDQINLHATKLQCLKAGVALGEVWTWNPPVNLEHAGREAYCSDVVVSATKSGCLASTGDTSWDFYKETCSRYHVLNQTECVAAEHTWNAEVLATGTMAYITEKAFTAHSNGDLTNDELAATLKYEDERLTCAQLGVVPQQSGAQRSKYDRVRLVLWVDVLRLKDLYNEGKGASSILSRGLPVGLTEGYDSGCKDCEIREVGQHKLESSDQDVVYYNAVTGKACSKARLGGNCKEYSFASGYRATGTGDTFRGSTQLDRDERNQIRQVVGKYLVRDVGLNSAGATGKPFWNDDLTTISYIGTATTSITPLEESVQDLRENFGDSKIYSRYMIELFSDCLDRTRVQEHSSRLEFQIFKEGRLHGDRLRDSLPELQGGAWNAGMPTFDVTASEAGPLLTIDATTQDFRAGDLITVTDCATASDDKNYFVAGTSETAELTTVTAWTTSAVNANTYVVDIDYNAGEATVTQGTSKDCSDASDAVALTCCKAHAEAESRNALFLYTADDNSGASPKTKHTCDTFNILSQPARVPAIGLPYEGSVTYNPTGNYVFKLTLADFPTAPREAGAPLTSPAMTFVEKTSGGCSDTTITDQATCLAPVGCSNPSITDQTVCTAPVGCSDTNIADQTACLTPVVGCSNTTFTSEASCEAEKVGCSDTSLEDETSCLAEVGGCDGVITSAYSIVDDRGRCYVQKTLTSGTGTFTGSDCSSHANSAEALYTCMDQTANSCAAWLNERGGYFCLAAGNVDILNSINEAACTLASGSWEQAGAGDSTKLVHFSTSKSDSNCHLCRSTSGVANNNPNDAFTEYYKFTPGTVTPITNEATCIAPVGCSNDNLADETACLAPHVGCSDGTTKTKAQCLETVGCSDGTTKTQAECIAIVGCSDGTDKNAAACTADIGCSDGTDKNQATCESDIGCSDGTDKNAAACTADIGCSDSSNKNQATCLAAGTCSVNTHATESACEAITVVSSGASLAASNALSLDATECKAYADATAGISWTIVTSQNPVNDAGYPMGCYKAGTSVYINTATSSTQNCDTSFQCIQRTAVWTDSGYTYDSNTIGTCSVTSHTTESACEAIIAVSSNAALSSTDGRHVSETECAAYANSIPKSYSNAISSQASSEHENYIKGCQEDNSNVYWNPSTTSTKACGHNGNNCLQKTAVWTVNTYDTNDHGTYNANAHGTYDSNAYGTYDSNAHGTYSNSSAHTWDATPSHTWDSDPVNTWNPNPVLSWNSNSLNLWTSTTNTWDATVLHTWDATVGEFRPHASSGTQTAVGAKTCTLDGLLDAPEIQCCTDFAIANNADYFFMFAADGYCTTFVLGSAPEFIAGTGVGYEGAIVPVGHTLSAGCKIAQKERECDGYSFDIRTDALLAKASPVYDSFQIDTRDICGPVELDTTGCGDFTNPDACDYLKPCGSSIPDDVRNDFGWPSTCTIPSGARCQICNRDTPQCYDGVGTNVPNGALVGHTMHEDMQCAGYDFTNPNIKLGITTKQLAVGGSELQGNLDFVDIPVGEQTYGNIYGAELLEFSVGLRLLDTIDFEQDQYLKLKGIGSRTEVVAWLKNNRIGEMDNLRDVRDMGDLTYPQLTTEEIVFTVQSYDREHDPNNFNVNIESLTVCSHQPPSYFEPFIASGAINRNVVNCLIGQPNAGVDAFGQALDAAGLANAPDGSDPCLYVFQTCPHKSGTGYTMKREEDDFFLLADYRPMFGSDGHLFVGDTCDMLAVSRALDMLSLPDMGHPEDNDLVYINARNIPLQSVGGTMIAGAGRDAVASSCVNPPSATSTAPEASDFFKALGPRNDQVPVSQTIVRNFKSMAIEDAKILKRGVREVIPCRRLSTHGDNLSPEFANAILYGYQDSRSYGTLPEFGDKFEPKSCWRDGYITTCKEPHTDIDRTAQLDTAAKCSGPSTTKPRTTVSLLSHKCEEFAKGTISSSSSAIDIQVDGSDITDKAVCLQQCKEQHFEKCIFYGSEQQCKGDNGNLGNIEELLYDATSTNWVTNCSVRADDIVATAEGQFKGITTALASADNVTVLDLEHAESICGTDAACIGFHSKLGEMTGLKCDTGGNSYALHANESTCSSVTYSKVDDVTATEALCADVSYSVLENGGYCASGVNYDLTATIQANCSGTWTAVNNYNSLFTFNGGWCGMCTSAATSNAGTNVHKAALGVSLEDSLTITMDVIVNHPVTYNGKRDSCQKLCQVNSPSSTIIEYVANNGANNGVCKCKSVTASGTCSPTAAVAVTNHFIIPNKLGADARPVSYEFFQQVDPDELGTDEVLSTRYYKVTEHNCNWCKWTNADKRTHSNDSEDCMSNVLSHLSSATSFQTYMDNIGGSVNFEEEVCVQKNNLWREKGTKHIPCGYRSLYNFNMNSVYEPEGWSLTDEEKLYRLSPDSPSWDAIIFHPEDVGDIAQHWEPVTKDFILPIKAEIIIHGSTCLADYDTTSGDSISNGRRRLLGNKHRVRIGGRKPKRGRKLLQFDDADAMVPDARFGGTTSSAFNVLVSVTAANVAAKQVLGPKGEVLQPTDPLYPIQDVDGDGDVQDDIYATVHKMQVADLECLDHLGSMWLGLSFVLYYVLLFILSLFLLNVPDEITGKPMNIFFDVLAE